MNVGEIALRRTGTSKIGRDNSVTMATIPGQFTLHVGVVVLLLLGLATPAFSLFINTSNPSACSRTCESKNCLDPAKLRYGKYCGIGYTGCSGEAACDGLDTCCQTHDNCIGSNLANYLNRTCNDNLKSCASAFQKSSQPQFAGANCTRTEVDTVIVAVMDIATVGGYGNPSSPMNLHWVAILVFILSIVLFQS